MKDAPKQKAAVALLSVTTNSLLVMLKLAVGVMIGSVSVISEAVHSSVDLLAALISLSGSENLWQACRSGSSLRPWKDGERLRYCIEALLIFLAVGWIILEAIRKLQNPAPLGAAGWGVGVMLVASTANILVSQRLFQVGKERDSVALQADAWHLRTDVYTSAGVVAGLS